jgi:hypothetical protein
MHKLPRPIAVIGAVFAAAMAFAGTAQAVPADASSVHARAATSSASPHVVRVTVPMRIVGFNAAVARAHGYVIRTDSHGRQYSVKAGAATAATPNNRVYGNCGSSYIFETPVGNHAVDIGTGFDVNTPAVAYYWKYWMADGGGTSSHTVGPNGLLRRTHWGENDRWGALTPGPADSWVDSGSDAILENGDVCSTAGPRDFTIIY